MQERVTYIKITIIESGSVSCTNGLIQLAQEPKTDDERREREFTRQREGFWKDFKESMMAAITKINETKYFSDKWRPNKLSTAMIGIHPGRKHRVSIMGVEGYR